MTSVSESSAKQTLGCSASRKTCTLLNGLATNLNVDSNLCIVALTLYASTFPSNFHESRATPRMMKET